MEKNSAQWSTHGSTLVHHGTHTYVHVEPRLEVILPKIFPGLHFSTCTYKQDQECSAWLFNESSKEKSFNWHVFPSTGSVWDCTGWYLVVLGHYEAVLVGTWWHWVSEGGSGWDLVVLGQYNLVLFGIKRCWVSKVLLCQYILKKK